MGNIFEKHQAKIKYLFFHDKDCKGNITKTAKKIARIARVPYTDNLRRSLSYYLKETEVIATHEAKILLYDIETSPLISYHWGLRKQNISYDDVIQDWKLLCFSAKWLFSDEIITDKLTKKELQEFDDERLTKRLWKLLDEADIVIGHNCVTTDTKVLKNDLTWVEAKDLKIGDELVGFEEGNNSVCRSKDVNGKWTWNGRGIRKYKKTKVTGHEIKLAPVYRITFDDGSHVDSTFDHEWLGMSLKDKNHRWYTTEYLKEGYRCIKPFTPWEEDKSYNGGYLAGIIDADGSITKQGYYNINIYQSDKVNPDICQKISSVLEDLDIEYSTNSQEVNKIISTTYKGSSVVHNKTTNISRYFSLTGSRYDRISLIGKYRIKKGLRIFTADNMGAVCTPFHSIRTIVKKEFIGEREIVVMQTDEKTFIGNGYLMHNCKGFDNKKSTAKFLEHGLNPPSSYQSIDTLDSARRKFSLTSNRLDAIGSKFGIGRKVETPKGLWRSVMEKDYKMLKKMAEYCEGDTKLLEDVYLFMRPYIQSHPNLNLFITQDIEACPSCASTDLKREGKAYTTTVSQYDLYRCHSCGALSRNRKNKKLLSSIP